MTRAIITRNIAAALIAMEPYGIFGGSEIARYEQSAPEPTPNKEPRAERRRKEKAARKQRQKQGKRK